MLILIQSGSTTCTIRWRMRARLTAGHLKICLFWSRSMISIPNLAKYKFNLLTRVASLDVDSKDNIAWNSLPDKGWCNWSANRLRQKWSLLEDTVRTHNATHRGEPVTGLQLAMRGANYLLRHCSSSHGTSPQPTYIDL